MLEDLIEGYYIESAESNRCHKITAHGLDPHGLSCVLYCALVGIERSAIPPSHLHFVQENAKARAHVQHRPRSSVSEMDLRVLHNSPHPPDVVRSGGVKRHDPLERLSDAIFTIGGIHV